MAPFGKRKQTEPQKDEEVPPYIPLAAAEVKLNLFHMLKDGKGVHVESALGILGSLSGFACLVHAKTVLASSKSDSGLDVVETTNGKRFYVGDLINKPLIENKFSVWHLVGGAATQLGTDRLPDIDDIVRHTIASLGTDEFGVPRIRDKHRLHDLPVNYVRHLWPVILPVLQRHTRDPREFPIIYGLAAQQVMIEGGQVILPRTAAELVMECAVPMSKVDPNEVE